MSDESEIYYQTHGFHEQLESKALKLTGHGQRICNVHESFVDSGDKVKSFNFQLFVHYLWGLGL